MQFSVVPYESIRVADLRNGRADDNGQVAELQLSDGGGNPCRSCLDYIPSDEGMLIAGMRPFRQLNPYAECGPVFYCEKECKPWGRPGLPPVLQSSSDYLVKAYSADDRILYGTGQITPADVLSEYIGHLLQRPDVAFVDIRSSRNNCFIARAVC